MELSQQLLFFFSALGAFNGLLLAGYLLFFLQPAKLHNRLLGLLLLALSVRIGKSVFLYFNNELYRFYLQVGLTACFFIGPLLVVYVKARRDAIQRVPLSWWLSGGALVLFMLVTGMLRPYATHPEFWSQGFIKFIYGVWSVGILVAGWILWPVIRKREQWTPDELWTVSIYVGNLIVHLAYRYGSWGSYIVGALSFSFVFYLLALWFILQKRQAGFLVEEKPKYGDRKLDDLEANNLLSRCDNLMNKDRLFLRPDLKLPDLARAADTTPHQLSQALNDNLGQNFSAYLKTQRVRYAQQTLHSNDHLTLEAIGLEAGFGSKSAFYAAFKEVTGMTPAAWKRKQEEATPDL